MTKFHQFLLPFVSVFIFSEILSKYDCFAYKFITFITNFPKFFQLSDSISFLCFFVNSNFTAYVFFYIFVVITSSCRSNYHTVTTTTVPGYEWNRTNILMFLISTVLCSCIKQPSNDINICSSNTHVRSKVYQELYHYVVYITNERRNMIIIN